MFAVPGVSSGAETPGRIDLSGLSRTERSELLRCLEEGEMAEFRRRFSEIKSLDPQTLKGVLRLASRYDYPALFTVLSQEPPLKPPA
jgi:hypothetical protein